LTFDPSPIDRNISNRLRLYRLKQNISTENLDQAINAPLGTVESFERGTRPISTLNLLRLGRALGIEISVFFDGLRNESSRANVDETQIEEVELFAKAFNEITDATTRRSLLGLAKSAVDVDRDEIKQNLSPSLDTVQNALSSAGFLYRGAFHVRPKDGVPGNVATLVLVGNTGPNMWRTFTKERQNEANPLDSWTRRKLTPLAKTLGAGVLFPFDGAPHLPFQKWAQRAEAVHASPLGILIHPDYGLWHAYRGALVFAEKLALPPPKKAPHPCHKSSIKPCLKACPIDAFKEGYFDAETCVEYMNSPQGGDCLHRGCAARLACPVGRQFTYPASQMHHHMKGFIEAYTNKHRTTQVD
jgi:transcriptional regulator with XRE-family HTH domain